jgi:Glycosyl transferase family 2
MVIFELMIPESSLPMDTAAIVADALQNWRMTGNISMRHFRLMNPLQRAIELEAQSVSIRWQASPPLHQELALIAETPAYQWPQNPTILALIPHSRCETWLRRCLNSLCQQTQPPTHIVVIDDASTTPPLSIVQDFPNVTLLTTLQQVGPYRLIQSAIDATDYDAYLFQDADDWSTVDRLESLLRTARQHGAELVGSQEIRVLEPELMAQAVGYPLDVNQALKRSPGHPLLHPTSLVTRDLVQRLGGFATGLKFGGDTEFLLRAHWVARIVNSPRYCYFRRKRPDSLTTAIDTGLDSPARKELLQMLKQRAIEHYANPPTIHDLKPLQTADPIALTYLCGPVLRWSDPCRTAPRPPILGELESIAIKAPSIGGLGA